MDVNKLYKPEHLNICLLAGVETDQSSCVIRVKTFSRPTQCHQRKLSLKRPAMKSYVWGEIPLFACAKFEVHYMNCSEKDTIN